MIDKISCEYCGDVFNPEEDEINPNGLGYWCGSCDYYNFFDSSKARPKFTMILEGKGEVNEVPVELKTIRMNKRLSPLRYPRREKQNCRLHVPIYLSR